MVFFSHQLEKGIGGFVVWIVMDQDDPITFSHVFFEILDPLCIPDLELLKIVADIKIIIVRRVPEKMRVCGSFV